MKLIITATIVSLAILIADSFLWHGDYYQFELISIALIWLVTSSLLFQKGIKYKHKRGDAGKSIKRFM